MTLLRVEIPMKLPSAGNLHEHWRTRHARIKAQRFATRLALGKGNGRLLFSRAVLARGESLTVTLTRVSPKKLDSDNLAFAFKGIRDQVAEELGVDDGDASIEWLYAQEKGEVLIRIHITKRDTSQGATP